MSDFNFDDIKVTVAKEAPKQTRTRLAGPNPFTDKLLQSLAKGTDADGTGTWLQMALPIKDAGEKAPYGEVVKKAMNLIATAAAAMDKGSDRHILDNGDGTVTLSFRARARRAKAPAKSDK